VGTSTALSEAVVQNSDLATQDIDAGVERTNGVPPPTDPASTETPIPPDGEISFPSDLLEAPR